MLSPDEINKYLAKAFRDVNVDPWELYLLLTGEKDQAGRITKERLYRRLMETYSWYQILEIVPGDKLESMLNEQIIEQLRSKTLQKRYATLAEILRTNTVSASG